MPVEDVIIQLAVENAKLNAGLAEANRKIAGFARDAKTGLSTLEGAVNSLQKAFAAIGGLIAVDFLKNFVTESIHAQSEIVDLADALGITTESLQELHFAATQNGIAIETMDRSLVRLSKTAGEAAAGNKNLLAVFNSMHIDLEANKDLLNDLPKLLELVLKGSDNFANAADKTRVRIATLGRGSADLGRIAVNGAEELTKAARIFEERGLGISDEDLRKAKEGEQAIGQLGTLIRTEFAKTVDDVLLGNNTMLRDIGDFIKKASALFKQFGDDLHAASKAKIDAEVTDLEARIVTLKQAAKDSSFDMRATAQALLAGAEADLKKAKEFQARVTPPPPDLGPAGANFGSQNLEKPNTPPPDPAAQAEAERIARHIKELNGQIDELKIELSGLALPDDFDRQIAAATALFAKQSADANAAKSAQEQSVELDKARLTLLLKEEQVRKRIADQQDELFLALRDDQQRLAISKEFGAAEGFDQARLNLEIGQRDALDKAGNDTASRKLIIERFKVLNEQLDESQKRATDFTNFLFNTASQAIDDFAGGISDAFAEFASGNKDAKQSFEDFIRSFLTGISAAILKAGELLLIQKALGTDSSTFLGQLGANIRLASGGIVTGPTRALVGESGPEAVIPLSQLGKMVGGGGDVTVVIENNGPPIAASNVSTQQRGQKRVVTAQVGQAVAADNASNGTGSKSMQTTFGLTRQGQRRG